MAQTFMCADDGVVPNNPVLPMVIMAAATGLDADDIRARYRQSAGPTIDAWINS